MTEAKFEKLEQWFREFARTGDSIRGAIDMLWLLVLSGHVAEHRPTAEGPPPTGGGWRPVGGYYVPAPLAFDAKGKQIAPDIAGAHWTVWSRVQK